MKIIISKQIQFPTKAIHLIPLASVTPSNLTVCHASTHQIRFISVKETKRRMREQEEKLKETMARSKVSVKLPKFPIYNTKNISTDDAFQRLAFYSLAVMRRCGVFRKAIAEGNAHLAFERIKEFLQSQELDALSSQERAMFVQLMVYSFSKKNMRDVPAEQLQTVLEVLKTIDPIDANPEFYVDLIEGFGANEDVMGFETVWQEAERMYPVLPAEIVAALIRAYVNNGLPRQAVNFASHQVNEGKVDVSGKLMRSIVMAFASCGRPQDGFELYPRIRHHGKHVRLSFIKSLLHALASSSSHISKGYIKRVLEVAQEEGIELDTSAYNAVMLAFVRNHNFPEAIVIFEEMISSDMVPGNVPSRCRPNLLTLKVLLELYFKANNIEEVYKVWDLFQVLSITPDLASYTTMMDGFRRIGDDASVQLWFDKLVEAGLQPDVICYSVIVTSLGNQGKFEQMENLVARMQDIGMNLTRQLYHAVLSSYAIYGKYEDVQRWFKIMTDSGMIANSSTFELLIQGATLAKRPAQEVEELYALAKDMDLIDDTICHRMMVFYLFNGHSLSDAVSRVPLSPDMSTPRVRKANRIFALLMDAALRRDNVWFHVGHPDMKEKLKEEYGPFSYPELTSRDYKAIQSVYKFLRWRNNGSLISKQIDEYYANIIPRLGPMDTEIIWAETQMSSPAPKSSDDRNHVESASTVTQMSSIS